MSAGEIFVLEGDAISSLHADGAVRVGAATLFGAPRPTEGPATPSASMTAHELADLVAFVLGTGQPLTAPLLVMKAASDLDHPELGPWLDADAQRLGVVLATSNEQVAEVLAHPLANAGRIAPAGSLGECLELCVNVSQFLRSGAWAADESARGRAISAVFAAALSPEAPPLPWHVVEGIATRLLEHIADDTEAGWELAFARAVALRHQGIDALLDWPETLAERSLAEQWTILAHVVQSAADGDLGRAEIYAKMAIDALDSPVIEASEDAPTLLARWRLRGAIGRALAAVGAYEAARGHLDACVAHWSSAGSDNELSFPLCEALRIAGLERDGPYLAELRMHADRLVAGGDTDGYVRLALGRALTQTDQPLAAAAYLRPVVEATTLPDHVHAAACRWLVKASIATESWADATQARGRLEALVPLPDQAYLARLDEALRQHDLDGARRALDGLLVCGPLAREARRSLARIRAFSVDSDERTVLSRLADEYRY